MFSEAQENWYDTAWLYRKELTFNNSLSSENLINFPVLVHLNDTYIDWSNVQNAGEDIRFTDDDKLTLLPYEIELWNDTYDAYIWVNVPQIDANSETDSIYMYYGNPSASDNQNVTGTWNTGYVMVQHFNEETNATVLDSTSNDIDLTPQPLTDPANSTIGKINNATDLDGSNDRFYKANEAALQITGNLTLEAYVKLDNLIADQRLFHKDWIREYALYIGGVTGNWYHLRFQHGDGAAETWSVSTNNNNITCSGWTYLVATRNTGTTKLYGYINGTLHESPSYVKTPISGNEALWLGARKNADRFIDGSMDEMRISNVVRSSEWIEAQQLSLTDQYFSFSSESSRIFLTVYFDAGINLYVNGTLRTNGTEIVFAPNDIANVSSIAVSQYTFFKHVYGSTSTLDEIVYLTVTANQTVWGYSFREGATEGFMLATIFLLLFIGVPLIAIMYRRK